MFIYEWMNDRNSKFIIDDEVTIDRLINRKLPQDRVNTLYFVY